MKIFATGDQRRLNELREKSGAGIEVAYREFLNDEAFNDLLSEHYDVIIDLNLDDHPGNVHFYSSLKKKIVIGCAVKVSLAQLRFGLNKPPEFSLVGMNLLPTFINRDKAEVAFSNLDDAELFDVTAKQLGWEYVVVEDSVGMVTPRVISMVINEACFALEEGTASLEDIDKGMKLGTNYPYGPFEWCDRIGVKEVYETLEAIMNNTPDERYKISALLKNKYLEKERFYNH